MTLPGHHPREPKDHPPFFLSLPLRSSAIQGETDDDTSDQRSVMANYEGYCVKCREKREFDGQEVELANGRRAAQGTCPVCGTKMNRILGKAKV